MDERACVGDATNDQGFTDLGTLDVRRSEHQLSGLLRDLRRPDADTFDPNANVTRSEMALFLYAAAGLMGVDLMGGDMMVDYGDISELGENRQNAITALASATASCPAAATWPLSPVPTSPAPRWRSLWST